MRLFALIAICLSCPACAEFTFRVPLGEGAKYGYVQNTTKYIPPDDLYQSAISVLNPPTLRDK